MNLRGNHGLGLIVRSKCRFTDYNKGTSVVGMPMVEEAVYLRDRGYWELFVLAGQICSEPKTSLKIKLLNKSKQSISVF